MTDYISREAAITAIRESPIANLATRFYCEDTINDIPAADVVEQKHGKWIEDGYYDEPYVCSICGEPAPVKEEGSHDHVCTKYCYNCGARMDGGS